jgi:hypothetical protein
LLGNVEVAAAIAEKAAKQLDAADLTATRILEELRRLALSDRRSFYRDDGTPKPISELTPEQGSALMDVEVMIKNAAAGDGHTDTVHKFRLWDKPKALELLAKRFGLLEDKLAHSGTVVFTWQD